VREAVQVRMRVDESRQHVVTGEIDLMVAGRCALAGIDRAG
jgi:hypothetical protein